MVESGREGRQKKNLVDNIRKSVRVCVRAFERACMRARTCVCVYACKHACVRAWICVMSDGTIYPFCRNMHNFQLGWSFMA